MTGALHYDATEFGPLDPCPWCRTRTEVHEQGCQDDPDWVNEPTEPADAWSEAEQREAYGR